MTEEIIMFGALENIVSFFSQNSGNMYVSETLVILLVSGITLHLENLKNKASSKIILLVLPTCIAI